MNRFEGLVEFMAVMEAESFSGAARKLGASVAHISRHVAALESRLGTKLFVRTTRRVTPTMAGERLASASIPLLEELVRIQEGISMSTESLEGQIRLSMAGHFAEQQVVPLLTRFCAAHPRVRLDIDMSSRPVDLLDGRFDFALRTAPLENSTALIARRFAEMPMVTLAHPTLVQRLENEIGARLSPLTVPESRCLSFAGRSWRFRKDTQVCMIKPAGPFFSNSASVLIKAAADGLGLIHVPSYYIRDDNRSHQLMPVFNDWHTEDSIVFNIVYARNRFMPSRVRLLIDHLLSYDFSERIKGTVAERYL